MRVRRLRIDERLDRRRYLGPKLRYGASDGMLKPAVARNRDRPLRVLPIANSGTDDPMAAIERIDVTETH